MVCLHVEVQFDCRVDFEGTKGGQTVREPSVASWIQFPDYYITCDLSL